MSIAETLKHLLARRHLPPRPEGPLPEADEDTDMLAASGERLVGGETLVLYYTDSKGNDSVRRITVNKVDETHIHAWCHERLGNRKFRIKGVRHLGSLDGEVYTNLEEMLPSLALGTLGQLEPELLDVEEDSFWHVRDIGEHRYYSLRDKIKNEILLLKAIARSDGTADKTEDDAIISYVQQRMTGDNHELKDEQVEITKRWVSGLYPEPFEIDEAVPSLKNLQVEEIKGFLSAAKSIVIADGKIEQEEVALYEKIGKEILAEIRGD